MPNGQDGFETDDKSFDYNDKNLETLVKYISSDRLAAYIIYTRTSDLWVAMRLYERNTEISEALYGVMQALEVALRNAMHNALTHHFGTDEWYDKFDLGESEREAVAEAKETVKNLPAVLTPGRIIAELTFGFWVKLTAHMYEEKLWKPVFTRIFPMRFSDKRGQIHARLKDLKTLRNRIAHHERITCDKRDPEKDYAAILETIAWINPTMRRWVESTNCFEERFAKRLPKKPKAEKEAAPNPAEEPQTSSN